MKYNNNKMKTNKNKDKIMIIIIKNKMSKTTNNSKAMGNYNIKIIISSKMVQYIVVNFLINRDMDTGYKCGLMVLNTKEIGKIIVHEEKGNFGTSMAIFIKDNGLMIKQMDTEYIFIQTELNIKVIGNKICRMDMVLKHGQMEQNMKEII